MRNPNKNIELNMSQSYSLAGFFFYDIGFFLTESLESLLLKYRENEKYSDSEIIDLKQRLRSALPEDEKTSILTIPQFLEEVFFEDWAEAVKRYFLSENRIIPEEAFPSLHLDLEETFNSVTAYVQLSIDEFSSKSYYLLQTLKEMKIDPERYKVLWLVWEDNLELVINGLERCFEWDGGFIDYSKRSIPEERKTNAELVNQNPKNKIHSNIALRYFKKIK
jgi:hypothetical protein